MGINHYWGVLVTDDDNNQYRFQYHKELAEEIIRRIEYFELRKEVK